MIGFINKKLEFGLQFFCIFVFEYLCICVFRLGKPALFPVIPSLSITSSETKVTDWHIAPSICVKTDQLQGTASLMAK